MAKVDIEIGDLVKMVKRGEIKLPEMQRRYVWTATRVRDLLDSLYRNYPSGSILVWETDGDVETRDMAVTPTMAPTHSSVQLLLDGQQRLTSLTAVLSGQPVTVRNKKRPIEILFNLEHPDRPPAEVMELDSEELASELEDIEGDKAEPDIMLELRKRAFVVYTPTLRNDPLWIPVSDIFTKSDSVILRAIGINSDDPRWDKYSERIQKVRKIADYKYTMEVLGRDLSYEEVTEIFVRVNSLGVKLRGSDLALAQITSRWPGFMNEMETFAEQFKENADYLVETGVLVRTMVAFATGQSKFKTVGRIKLEDLQDSWVKTKDGIEYAINFLRQNAHVERLWMLSSPFLIVCIAIHAVQSKGAMTTDDEKKLLKWFYYAHMRGHYGMGSSESLLDADLAVLTRGGTLTELLDKLYQHVRKFEVDAGDIQGKSTRSPFFSTLYFVLKARGAKDWKTGLTLSDAHLGSAHKIQFHHIFPKSLLARDSVDPKLINEMANMAFIGGKINREILNKKPNEYLDKMIVSVRGEDALTSQLVTLDRSLWELERFPDFLADRRAKIATSINEHMSQYD